jgi:probable F420-dependent oxidoreductase
MTPFFNPGPHDYPRIPIYIAGVNRRMCRLAGELCDGFHVHPLHTRRYLQQVICQNIQLGLTKGGRLRENIELSGSIFVIPTNNPEEAAIHESEVRQQISFYASTPPYRPVFELHGWGAVADQLRQLAAGGKWHEMPRLITDEMIDTFALRSRWEELPRQVLEKYSGLLDRVSYYFPFLPGQNDDGWRATISGFKSQVAISN